MRKIIFRTLTAATLTLLPVILHARTSIKPKPSGIIELSGDFIIPVTMNGKALKLQVDPDIESVRLINPEIANALSLKTGGIFGVAYTLGPIEIEGDSRRVDIDFGDIALRRRVVWFQRPASSAANGVIGPGGLPYEIIRFNLRPKVAGERALSLPLSPVGIFGVTGGEAYSQIGGRKVDIGFSFERDENVVVAPTGVLIARLNGGGFSGEKRNTVIRFGIQRPVRPMSLVRPIEIGGIAVSNFLVRTTDFGDSSSIPEGQKVDEDEIVVTAKSKKKRNDRITLGRSFLSKCSSLTYDFPAKLVRLSCL
jgi:hypothetical protein